MKDETQEIDSGLREESLDAKVKRLAAAYDSEKLFEFAQCHLTKTVGEMAEAGGYFSAIREREQRGFKSFFDGRKIEYRHALHFIHCCEILDRHPKFAGLKSGRAVRELFSLSKPNQAEIAERLSDVPIDEIQHVARGEIDRLHRATSRRKDHVGGRGKAPALELVQRWCNEIDTRLEKIHDLIEMNLLEEAERLPLAHRLWHGAGLAHWRLKHPHGDVPCPEGLNPLLWHDIEPEDGPVETPEYDISSVEKREVRVSLQIK